MLSIITMLFVVWGIALIVLLYWKIKNFQAIRQLHYEEYRRKKLLKQIRELMLFFGCSMDGVSDEILQSAIESFSDKIKDSNVTAHELTQKVFDMMM